MTNVISKGEVGQCYLVVNAQLFFLMSQSRIGALTRDHDMEPTLL